MADDIESRQLDLIKTAVAAAFEARDRGQTIPTSPPIVAVTEKELRAIVREEMADDRARSIEECRKAMHFEVENLFKEFLEEQFAIIGVRIDNPDKVEETRRMFDELRRAQQTAGEFKHEALKEMAKALGVWLGGGLLAALTYLGFKGGSH